MNGLKVFDRALLGKKIAGNGAIVIIDVIYLIVGTSFGVMELRDLIRFLIFCNILCTCILYQNFVVARGDMRLELMTEKILFYPTTRYQFLWNKYVKTLLFLSIQLLLTLACLGLGYFGNRGFIEYSRIIISLLTVFVSILITSGIAILVMHVTPMGIYLAMLLYFPLTLLAGWLESSLSRNNLGGIESIIVAAIVGITIVLWLVLLWIGGKVYERVH